MKKKPKPSPAPSPAPPASPPTMAMRLLGPPVSTDDVSPEALALAQLAFAMMSKMDLPADWWPMHLPSLAAKVRTPFNPPQGYAEGTPSAFDIVCMEALRRARRFVDLAEGNVHAARQEGLLDKQRQEEDRAAAEDILRRFNLKNPGEGDVPALDVVNFALRRNKVDWPHDPNETTRLETWRSFLRHRTGVLRRMSFLPVIPVVFDKEPVPEGCSERCWSELSQEGDYFRHQLNDKIDRRSVPHFVRVLRSHWLDHKVEIIRPAVVEGGRQSGAVQREKAVPARRQKKQEALEDAEADVKLTAAASRTEESNPTLPAKKE